MNEKKKIVVNVEPDFEKRVSEAASKEMRSLASFARISMLEKIERIENE